MTTEERRVRRLAERLGYALRKSRVRTMASPAYAGFMIIDRDTGFAVAGLEPHLYSLSLEAAEGWLQGVA